MYWAESCWSSIPSALTGQVTQAPTQKQSSQSQISIPDTLCSLNYPEIRPIGNPQGHNPLYHIDPYSASLALSLLITYAQTLLMNTLPKITQTLYSTKNLPSCQSIFTNTPPPHPLPHSRDHHRETSDISHQVLTLNIILQFQKFLFCLPQLKQICRTSRNEKAQG